VQPVLMTPGHGAYPAGHSTQMHLVRLLLVDAWKLGGTAGDWRAEAATQLERLANRIAENRVVAGLHYEADNEAGKLLAQQLAAHVKKRAVPGAATGATSPAYGALEWLWKRAAAEGA